MNRLVSTLPAAAATVAAVLALGATAATAQTTTHDGLLRDDNGRTLYTFAKDMAGESRCFDGCAAAWPPFMAADGATAQGRLTVVARKGGGLQWTFDGQPLYYFAGDAKAGDVAGDGSGGVWHVVRPATAGTPRAQAPTPQPQRDPLQY